MPSRRAVLTAGTAWSVPAIITAAAAPAVAASPCSGCPTIGYGGGATWALATTGSLSAAGVIGWQPAFGGLTDVFAVSKDPLEAGTTVSYSIVLCLTAGTTYAFESTYALDTGYPRGINLRARILRANGTVAATVGPIISAATSAPGIGPWAGTYTATTTELVTFEWLVRFGESNPDYTRLADDVAVQAPTVTCTP